MKKQTRVVQETYKNFTRSLAGLPTPLNITYNWRLGSILGLTLALQIITGLLWASTYNASVDSFLPTFILIKTLDKIWLIRHLHINGASLFFILLYAHLLRGMYYMSYQFKSTWFTGVTILLLSMATAFLGYILPINQISFWAASVITNLFSELPYIGSDTVTVIWGGPVVSNPTLMRFFTFHFFFPFIIVVIVFLHILFLHSHLSSNPLGSVGYLKLKFHPNLTYKDILGFSFTIIFVVWVLLIDSEYFIDSENFIKADRMITPLHIKPEWYFLFAYAILRSIPNKIGGIIALLISVIILYFIPLINNKIIVKNNYYTLNRLIFWIFILILITLTAIGGKPVEDPYIITTQIITFLYFISYFMSRYRIKLTNRLIEM